MKKISAAEQRFLDNATLIAALELIFQSLKNSGCPIFRIDEIAETTSGGTPNRTVTAYYGGEIPWIKSGELNDGLIENAEEYITEQGLKNSSAKIYPKGTLVIALYGPTVGKTGILGIDAASNQAVCAVTPKSAEVSKKFLFWFLRHKRQDFLKDSFGGAQPNISQRILRETLVPIPSLEIQEKICLFMEIAEKRQKGNKYLELPSLPVPLDEQRRIVARIEELVGKVEEARGLRRQSAKEAEVLWASSAQKLVFELANKNLQPLGDLVTVRGGGTPSISNPFFWNGSIPWVCPKDMKILDIKDSIEHISEEATYCSSAKLVEPGCVLIVVRGMILDHTVPSAILRVPAAINQDMKALVPDKNILSEYLCKILWAMNHLLHELVEKSTHDTRKLETPKLLNFKIPVPPLPEQHRIVAYLDDIQSKVDALKRLQTETATELDALLPSILDKAFKGEL